ncbi:52 kDa repressor of the inhibitor of the protein kinase [Eumeta japonica]|uniref:52 kDa repressor of the inhibitor of the protein kinase n=1 Tax=Eumeta variegata TaxID=151549 RepID=A0A4C1VQD8_EUMVA|nr:52 kDa repressor of the inhibitor of the protein kinase [Eumeta japonica]
MVLQRLFDIILTLAKSSLALRGHREDLSQEGYHGNFLSFVELVARYDHILRQVLDMPKGSTRYLSATIQNEMIEILGTKLETHLLGQIRASSFFVIIMDTTQDISKVDQLSIVVRYAVITRSENGQSIDVGVKEVFLGFYAATKHGAADLVNQITSLESSGAPFFDLPQGPWLPSYATALNRYFLARMTSANAPRATGLPVIAGTPDRLAAHFLLADDGLQDDHASR